VLPDPLNLGQNSLVLPRYTLVGPEAGKQPTPMASQAECMLLAQRKERHQPLEPGSRGLTPLFVRLKKDPKKNRDQKNSNEDCNI